MKSCKIYENIPLCMVLFSISCPLLSHDNVQNSSRLAIIGSSILSHGRRIGSITGLGVVSLYTGCAIITSGVILLGSMIPSNHKARIFDTAEICGFSALFLASSAISYKSGSALLHRVKNYSIS